MPNFADIKAGGAFVELYTKNSKFYKGLRAASYRLTKWGQGATAIGTRLMGAGAAIAGPFLAAAKTFAKMGDDLDKMSARTGVSVESLSELSFAAQQSGSSIESLEGLLAKMNRRLGRVTAGAGSNSQVGAIEELGLSVDELEKKDAEGRFLAIADAMSKYGDQAAAAGLAQRIFGTNVDAALPLIMAGAEGIEAYRQQARDWGLVISEKDTKQAALFTDQMSILSKVLKTAVFSAGAALAPMLGEWVIKIAKVLKTASAWVKENQGLVVSIFKIGAAVAGVGAVFLALGTVLSSVGWMLGGIAAGWLAISAAATAVASVIGSALSFIFSWLGLVTVAVVGFGAYFLYQSGIIGRGLGWLGERFMQLKAFALDAFGGIKDALAAGDFQLAGQVLWAALKVQWTKGVNWLMEKWGGFKDWFLSGWTNTVYGFASVFTDVVGGLQLMWFDFADKVLNKWQGVEEAVATAFSKFFAWQQGLDPDQVVQTLQEDYARKAAERSDSFEARRQKIGEDLVNRQAELEAKRLEAQEARSAAAQKRAEDAEAAFAKAQADYDALRQEARELAESAPEKAKDEMPTMPTPEGPAIPALEAGQSSLAQTATVFTKEFYTAIFGRDREDQAQRVRFQQLDAQLAMAGKMASIDGKLSGFNAASIPAGG